MLYALIGAAFVGMAAILASLVVDDIPTAKGLINGGAVLGLMACGGILVLGLSS